MGFKRNDEGVQFELFHLIKAFQYTVTFFDLFTAVELSPTSFAHLRRLIGFYYSLNYTTIKPINYLFLSCPAEAYILCGSDATRKLYSE